MPSGTTKRREFWRLGDEGNPSRASDLEQLRGMQKSARPRDEFLEHAKNKSIADSLRSLLSGSRPRVSTREPRVRGHGRRLGRAAGCTGERSRSGRGLGCPGKTPRRYGT